MCTIIFFRKICPLTSIIAFFCICLVFTQNHQQSLYNKRQQHYDSEEKQHDTKNDQQNVAQNNTYVQKCFNFKSQLPINDHNCSEEYCYMSDEDPYLYFGSGTPYQVVYGHNQSNQNQLLQECTPIQFWSIIRHGARLPKTYGIESLKSLNRLRDEIVKNYEQEKSYPEHGKLCNEDFELLKGWRWNESITLDVAALITEQGVEDMRLLARRYRTRFGNLLNVSYSSNHYHFQYIDNDRTTYDSYKAYVDELFGNNSYMGIANAKLGVQTLQPHISCKAWLDQVQNNPDTSKEYRRFLKKTEYISMLLNISKRLGFTQSLNETTVKNMYSMCHLEKAWYLDRPSPWCSVFTKDELQILEYANDLHTYSSRGYGHELNKRIECPLVKDFYERFEKTVNGNKNEPKVIVYFSHSITIHHILVAMGIAQDQEPLTADNYYQQYLWRSTFIVPLAANIAVVLYQCDDNTQPQDKYKVMFLLNEQPVDYEGCSFGLCSWQWVKDRFQQISENCSLDFCERGRSDMATSGVVIYMFNLLLLLVIWHL